MTLLLLDVVSSLKTKYRKALFLAKGPTFFPPNNPSTLQVLDVGVNTLLNYYLCDLIEYFLLGSENSLVTPLHIVNGITLAWFQISSDSVRATQCSNGFRISILFAIFLHSNYYCFAVLDFLFQSFLKKGQTEIGLNFIGQH